MTTRPVAVRVSQATRLVVSSLKQASRMASEIWSAILSGWPSVTDSEVKRYRFFDAKFCFSFGARVVQKIWDSGSAGRKSRGRGGAKNRKEVLMKRLTDGFGARNGFGLKGRRVRLIAE